jgi:hypothetical protein
LISIEDVKAMITAQVSGAFDKKSRTTAKKSATKSPAKKKAVTKKATAKKK